MLDRRDFIAGGLLAATAPDKVCGQPQRPKTHLLAVGVKKYRAFDPLANPALDALLVGDTFRKLVGLVDQVSISMILDGTRDEILAGAAHARKTSGDGPIVMFFAGHGVQVEGRSYLVPPDCTYWTTAYDVKREGLEVGFLIETYTMAKGSSFMLFLDACRNNPFADADWAKGARGLSAPVATSGSTVSADEWVLPTNVAISYSTQPGMVAEDGPPGMNSPYAKAFASILRANPLITYRALVEQIEERVVRASNGEQIPWFRANINMDLPILSPT